MPEEKENEMEQETSNVVQAEQIEKAVAECFNDGGEAYGLTGDEAIDAVIAKLEGMKGGEESENTMGGLGSSEGMSLGDLKETD